MNIVDKHKTNMAKGSFQRFSGRASALAGSTLAFVSALLVIIVWLVFGPRYHFSNTWLVVITAITDIVVFLMVFLIQNTQNRDSKAIQLKLNELISADQKARDTFIGLETMTDSELEDLDQEFRHLIETVNVTPTMQKLHKHIANVKDHRFNFHDEAEHIVDALFSPIGGKDDPKK
jgi:low affinity Fe/Cu permease